MYIHIKIPYFFFLIKKACDPFKQSSVTPFWVSIHQLRNAALIYYGKKSRLPLVQPQTIYVKVQTVLEKKKKKIHMVLWNVVQKCTKIPLRCL